MKLKTSSVRAIFEAVAFAFRFNLKYSIGLLIASLALSSIPFFAIYSSAIFAEQVSKDPVERGRESLLLIILITVISSLLRILFSLFQQIAEKSLAFFARRRTTERLAQLDLKELEDSEIQNQISMIMSLSTFKISSFNISIASIVSGSVALVAAIISVAHYTKPIAVVSACVSIILIERYIKFGKIKYVFQQSIAEDVRREDYYSRLLIDPNQFIEIRAYQNTHYFVNKSVHIGERILSSEIRFITNSFLKFNLFEILFLFVDIVLLSDIFFGNRLYALRDAIILYGSFQLIKSYTQPLAMNIGSMFESVSLILLMKSHLTAEVHVLNEYVDKTNYISFNNVSFKYMEQSEFSVSNLSFNIHKGEKVAIIGRNGAGKSTIFKLLIGIYKPSSGSVVVNAESISSISQHFNTYEETIFENIVIGDINSPPDANRVRHSLFLASFRNHVTQNLDLQLGRVWTDGIQMSGGNLQKISLARSLYRDGDLYILDEPSAYMDPMSEEEYIENLKEVLTKEKTLVLITHRDAPLSLVDRVIEVRNGIIHYDGPYNSYRPVSTKKPDDKG